MCTATEQTAMFYSRRKLFFCTLFHLIAHVRGPLGVPCRWLQAELDSMLCWRPSLLGSKCIEAGRRRAA